jgi:hypothetical protein
MARQAVQGPSTIGKIGTWLWGAAILSMIVILTPATMIVFSLGALPTAVAWLCDRTKEKFATLCVGGLNVCGVFPYLLKIWFDDHSIDAALNIVSDVFALVIMYAAAGFGWALFLSIPPVVAAFLNVIAQSRVTYIRSVQKSITDEWGHTVSDTPTQPQEIPEAPAAPEVTN